MKKISVILKTVSIGISASGLIHYKHKIMYQDGSFGTEYSTDIINAHGIITPGEIVSVNPMRVITNV